MEAILNVVADKLAGDYQDQLTIYRPITHIYPSPPVVLAINWMTITSNVRHQLIKAEIHTIPPKKQVDQQDSTFNGMEMLEPGPKENR